MKGEKGGREVAEGGSALTLQPLGSTSRRWRSVTSSGRRLLKVATSTLASGQPVTLLVVKWRDTDRPSSGACRATVRAEWAFWTIGQRCNLVPFQMSDVYFWFMCHYVASFQQVN